MAIASGTFAELLWPGIQEIFGVSYNDYEPLWSKVFEVTQSDKRFEKHQGVTGLPLAGVKDEGNSIPYVDPYQGYQEEFVNVTYALGTSVTREMADDEAYGYINKLPKMLARSMRHTEEVVCWNHINRAQNASYTGADGVSLASASHPFVGGGTFSNQLATPSDLTQTSLETALQNLMTFQDDQQLYIRVMPKSLVIAPANNFRARKLLESAGVTGSADNDKNPLPGLFQNLIVVPWITDTDSWGIVTDVDDGFIFQNRRGAEIVRDNEFDTQNLKFATTRRFASGWVDPRCFYYTPGA